MVDLITPKDKRVILYVNRIAKIPTVIGKKKVSPFVTEAGLKKKLFPFNVSAPAFRIRNVFYYIVDVNEGQQHFKTAGKSIAPELLDAIITRQLGKQLVSALETRPLTEHLLLILIVLGFGTMLGYVLGNYMPM